MTEPCGCRIIYAQLSHGRISTDDLIDYCPLHLAAGEMLAALKKSHGRIFHDDGRICCEPDVPTEDEWHCPVALLIERASGVPHHCHCHAKGLIARAEGKGP